MVNSWARDLVSVLVAFTLLFMLVILVAGIFAFVLPWPNGG